MPGVPVLRVPPTLDVEGLTIGERQVDDSLDLSLVYAGTPGRKDLLAAIVQAVDRVDSKGVRIRLRVLGPSVAQVRELLGGPVPTSTEVLGRLAQQEVPAEIRRADFSVLMRRPARFSEAGFPTKFCESLANGTPVIANLTSDLGSYLRTGQEGIVCADYSVENLTEVLLAAARIAPGERGRMRRAARERALRSFDYRAYAEPMNAFLQAVR